MAVGEAKTAPQCDRTIEPDEGLLMNELYVFAGLVVIGFLSVISETRSVRKRLDSRLQRIEQVLIEIRDSLKTRS